MIKLNISPYCDDCPNFEVYHEKHESTNGNAPLNIIKCPNENICSRAYKKGVYDANRANGGGVYYE